MVSVSRHSFEASPPAPPRPAAAARSGSRRRRLSVENS
jgi:hypothetical protein